MYKETLKLDKVEELENQKTLKKWTVEELDYDMERLRQAIRHIADCYADRGVTYDFLLSRVKEYL